MSYQIQVELQEFMGSDRSIAEAAWTSSQRYSKKKVKTDTEVEALIRRLAKDKHAVPFESVVLRFWIKMPIQTDRQHMTHRVASHSGMSGRYRTMPNEFFYAPEDVKAILYTVPSYLEFVDKYNSACLFNNNLYQTILNSLKPLEKNGALTNKEYKRLREFFRGVLPQNNMTERVSIFNLRSLANYFKLRLSEHAQPEIRFVAQSMLNELKQKKVAPVAIKALEAEGWVI